MDKNTLTGLFLIGALLLGFTWLNQPSPEDIQASQSMAVPQQEVVSSSISASDALTTPDSAALANQPLYRRARASQTIELRNDKLSVRLSSQGAAPIEAVLSGFKNQAGESVKLFAPEDVRFNLPLRTIQNELLNTADLSFEVASQTDSTVNFRLPIEEGSYLELAYRLEQGGYRLWLDLGGKGLEKLLPANMSLQDIEWSLRMPQQEQSHRFEAQYSGIYHYSRGGSIDDLGAASQDEERIKESLRWIAFKDKYFSSALINLGGTFEDALLSIKPEAEDSGYISAGKVAGTFPFSLRDGGRANLAFFFGPNDYDLLTSYDKGLSADEQLHLDHLVYLGMSIFRWVNLYMIIPVVSFLKEYLSNWGLIILLMTILIKLVLYPFTYKSYMSQAKMRVLKPQIDEIAKKYEGKTDQDAMLKKQQETMALYSSAGASPLSGCLPMLLQMPFLIALYMYFPTSIFLRGESFLWAKDLSTYDAVISWDFNIPIISGLLGNHISLFCFLMTAVNVVYNRYMMSQSSAGSEAMPGMKYMPYMMSVMFFFMFNQNASALSYYYFISTLITIIQYFAFRFTLNEEKLLAQLEENKKKPKKKSKWMQRLEEAQRQQRELQRQREKSQR